MNAIFTETKIGIAQVPHNSEMGANLDAAAE